MRSGVEFDQLVEQVENAHGQEKSRLQKETGIIRSSPWSALSHIGHVLYAMDYDPMHVINEGVMKRHFQLILSYYVKQGLLSLSSLNASLKKVVYTSLEGKSRTAKIVSRQIDPKQGGF